MNEEHESQSGSLEAQLEREVPLAEKPKQANPFGRKRGEQPTTEEMLGNVNRQLPFSDEAEKGLLSSVFQQPDLLPEFRRKLQPEAFYDEKNRTVWEQLLLLADSNRPLDPVLVTNELRQRQLLDQVGGPAFTTELYTFMPVPSHAVYYLKIVLDNWMLRRLLHEAALTISEVHMFGYEVGMSMQEAGGTADVVATVTGAESRMFRLVEEVQALGENRQAVKTATEGVADWLDHMQATIDNRGKIQGLTTGIHELDMTMHGLDDKEGEIFVLAGRPAMGKTAMGGTLIDHLAVKQKVPGLVFSIEMSANQLYTRLVLGPAGIDTSKAVTGHLSRADMDAMGLQARAVQTSPLLISASAACSTADLRAQAQLAKRRHGIRWIMVDHLHLVRSVNPRVQGDERMRLVEVMETLQFLKKDLNLVVFLLVQMNRDTDKNPGKPPVLADLAGSAAIEQYADHVVFIHREDEYTKWHRLSTDKQEAWRSLIEPRRDRSPHLWSDGLKYDDDSGGFPRQDYEEKAMLFVRKNRRGPTPELQVRYQKELTRFSTRMPCLNSNDSRDWQMGSYASHIGSKEKKKKGFKPVGEMRPAMEEIQED